MSSDEIGTAVRERLEGVHPQPLDQDVIVGRVRRRRRRRHGAMVAGMGLIALVVVALLALGGPSSGPLGPPTVEASAAIPVPGEVVGTATEGGVLWVLTCTTGCSGAPAERSARGALVKVDNETGTILASTEIADPGEIAAGEGAVWIAAFPDGTLTRFDSQTLQATGALTLELPRSVAPGTAEGKTFLPDGLAVGEGAVWVATERGYVAAVDPAQVTVERMIQTPFSPTGITVGAGSVWLTAGLFGLAQINPATGDVGTPAPIEDADGYRLSLDDLQVVGGSLWVRGAWASPAGGGRFVLRQAGEFSLVRVDQAGAAITQIVGFEGQLSVKAASEGVLWLAGSDSDAGSAEVYALEPGASAVTRVAVLAEPGTIVGAVGRSLWVARAGQVLQRYEVPPAQT